MASDYRYRLYALLKATDELREVYGRDKLGGLTRFTRKLLRRDPYGVPRGAAVLSSFAAVGAPSFDWTPALPGDDEYDVEDLDELIVAYAFDDPARQQEFIKLVAAGQGAGDDATILATGADIGVATADHWCPGQAAQGAFGDRADAGRTINAGALPPALTGKKVNVVIVDQGLSQAAIEPANWGGGLNWQGTPPDTVLVGTADRTSHGMMIARNILDLAPDARLYDVPLLPRRIGHVDAFLSSAHAAYVEILRYIDYLRAAYPADPQYKGPWILVNAWAIFDRATETPLGDYTQNAHAPDAGSPDGHPLITEVRTSAILQRKFDVIFAAGNCGEFCFSIRCGKLDRGPGHSIWGANALPEVITVGAVRTDQMWAGYSSQGPGPGTTSNKLAHDKPDLCAPSNFCETLDAHVWNSGTSAACAITAGVVAALRSNPAWNQVNRSPAQMLAALKTGARKTQGPGWNQRLGNGILDVCGAMGNL